MYLFKTSSPEANNRAKIPMQIVYSGNYSQEKQVQRQKGLKGRGKPAKGQFRQSSRERGYSQSLRGDSKAAVISSQLQAKS